MTTTTHTIDACLGIGKDDGEFDVRITYTFLPGSPAQGPTYSSDGQPADPDEIEFVSCVPIVNGKESPCCGVFADLEQDSLNALAHAWLEGDEGTAQATENALDDLAGQQDAADEARAEARREDRT